jgi:hypothetical protein
MPISQIGTNGIADSAVVAVDIAAGAVTDAKLSLTTPALGTPSALVLTNATGLPASAMPTGSVIQTQTSISGFNSNIGVTNSSGGQSALYNTGVPGRVYVDLTTITITPTFSTSKFLVFSTTGLSAGTNCNNGAFGTVIVINNSTGIGFGGDFPWYPTLTSLGASYPPDSAMNAYYSPGSASAFTVYLKGYSYCEGSTQTTNFRNVTLIVQEIKQ